MTGGELSTRRGSAAAGPGEGAPNAASLHLLGRRKASISCVRHGVAAGRFSSSFLIVGVGRTPMGRDERLLDKAWHLAWWR